MSKPLATIGDQILSKGADWRADLRANGVPRRPPPASERASRPDRGYVEQPEERQPPSSSKPEKTTSLFPPMARRRVETPTLETPVALIRFERTTSYPLVEPAAPSPSEPPAPSQAPASPPAPEAAEVPKEGVKTVGSDGRRLFTPEFREKVMKAFDERPDGVIQKDIAKQFGIHQTVLSTWLQKRDAERKAAEKEAKRQATRAANKAAKNGSSPPPASTSRPSPSPVATSKPRGVRSFETVSLELAGAIAKVAELKRELRALLGDD